MIAPVGSISVGLIIDRYGRRTALLWNILPGIFGWLLLYLDLTVHTTLLGQVLNGLLCGASGYPSQVYAGECVMVNDVRMRNRFLSWISICNASGMFLTYILGYFLDYRKIAAVGLVLAVVTFLLIFCFIPESPLWLYLQGRTGDAEWSQKKLGTRPSASDRRRVSVLLSDEIVESRWSMVKASFMKLKRKDVYKPLLISILLVTSLSFIGGMSVMFYMVEIISKPKNTASYTSFSPKLYFVNDTVHHVEDTYMYSIIAGGVMVVANVFMSIVLPLVGVKTILIVPLLGMGLGMATEGYVTLHKYSDSLFTWHLAAMWLITFTYTSSILMIPDTMLADLFPVDAKGFASIPFLWESVLVAGVSKLHPYVFQMVQGYLYYFYGSMCVVSAVIVFLFIPEIVGRTLIEINDGFLAYYFLCTKIITYVILFQQTKRRKNTIQIVNEEYRYLINTLTIYSRGLLQPWDKKFF